MEIEIQETLTALYSNKIIDPEELSDSLRSFLEAQIKDNKKLSFIYITLIDSKNSLMTYLETHNTYKDNLSVNLKKVILNFMTKLFKSRKEFLNNKLPYLMKKLLENYKKENVPGVRNNYLGLIKTVIKNCDVLQQLDLESFIKSFLNEIQFFKPHANLLGKILQILGLLVEKKEDTQEASNILSLLFKHLHKEFQSKSPQTLVIIGVLKGLKSLLQVVQLNDEQKEFLVKVLLAGIQQIEEIKHYKIIKASMKLLIAHMKILIGFLMNREMELFNILLEYQEKQNRKVKEIASQTLIQFCFELSNFYSEDQSRNYQQNLIEFFTKKLKKIIQNEEDPNIQVTCIKAYGSFSKAIKLIEQGEEKLHDHLYFLIENTQSTLFNQFDIMENFHHEDNPENFKKVLYIQKQLISYLKSFSYIIIEFTNLKNQEINFITKIISICIKYQLPFFPPYKNQLCYNFTNLLNSLPKITYNHFIFKKFWKEFFSQLINHSSFLEQDHYEIYYDFLNRIISYSLEQEKKELLFYIFLKEFLELSDKSIHKNFGKNGYEHFDDEEKSSKILYFFCRIFLDFSDKSEIRETLCIHQKTLLNLYNVIEKKIEKSPLNLIYWRVLSCLSRLECIQQYISLSDPVSQNYISIIQSLIQQSFHSSSIEKLFLNELLISAGYPILTMNENNLNQGIPLLFQGIKSVFESNKRSQTQILQGLYLFEEIVKLLNLKGIYNDDVKVCLEMILKFYSFLVENEDSLLTYMYHSDDEQLKDNILNKIFDIISITKYEQIQEEKKYQKQFTAKANDLKLEINDMTIELSLENIFLYLLENFSDRNYNQNPKLFQNLLYFLGKLVLTNNQEFKKKYQGSDKDIQELKRREGNLLRSIMRVWQICFVKELTFKKSSTEFIHEFVRSVHLDENFFDDTIQPILKESLNLLNSQTKIVQSNTFWNHLKQILNESLEHLKQTDFYVSTCQDFLQYIKSNIGFLDDVNSLFQGFILQNIITVFYDIIVDEFSLLISEIMLIITIQIGQITPLNSILTKMIQEIIQSIESLQIREDDTDQLYEIIKHNLIKIFSFDIQRQIQILHFLSKSHLFPKIIERIDLFQNQEQSFLKYLFINQGINFNCKSLSFEQNLILLVKFDKEEHLLQLIEDNPDQSFAALINLQISEQNFQIKGLKFILKNQSIRNHLVTWISKNFFKTKKFYHITFSSIYEFKSLIQILCYLFKHFNQEELNYIFNDQVLSDSFVFLEDIANNQNVKIQLYQQATLYFHLLMSIKKYSIDFCMNILIKDISEFKRIMVSNLEKYNQQQTSLFLNNLLLKFTQYKQFPILKEFLKNFNSQKSFHIQIETLCNSHDGNEDDIVEIFNYLCEMEVAFDNAQIQQLQNSLQIIQRKENLQSYDYLIKILIKILKNRESVLCYYFEGNEFLKKILHKNSSIELSQIPLNSKEFEKNSEFIQSVFKLAKQSQAYEILDLIFFYMSTENSVYNSIILTEVNNLEKSINLLNFHQNFFKSFLSQNSFQTNFYYSVNLWNFFIQPIFKIYEEEQQIEFYEQNFKDMIAILKMPFDFENLFQGKNLNILIQKILVQKFFSQFYDRINNVSITNMYIKIENNFPQYKSEKKNAITKELYQLTDYILYDKEWIRNYSNSMNILKIDSGNDEEKILEVKKQIDELLFQSYNCLISLILKTQQKIEIIVGSLIYQEKEKKSVLIEMFKQTSQSFTFSVLTSFNQGDLNQPTFDDNFSQTFENFHKKTQNFDFTNSINDPLKQLQQGCTYELNEINQHPIMAKFILLNQKLAQNFQKEKFYWIQAIQNLYFFTDNLNLKIFLIQVISNNSSLLIEFKHHLNPLFIDYLKNKDNGGNGFHYFYRDVVSLFVQWNLEELIELQIQDMNIIVENMLGKLGDESWIIMNNNLYLFYQILRIFQRNEFIFDISRVAQLIKIKKSDPLNNIWKLVGLKVLLFLLENNFKVRNGGFKNSFTIDLLEFVKGDIMDNLMSMLKLNSKTICYDVGKIVGLVVFKSTDEEFKNSICNKIQHQIMKFSLKNCLFLEIFLSQNTSLFIEQSFFRKIIFDIEVVQERRNQNYLVRIMHKILENLQKDQLGDYIFTEILNFLNNLIKYLKDKEIFENLFLMMELLLSILNKNQLLFLKNILDDLIIKCQPNKIVNPHLSHLLHSYMHSMEADLVKTLDLKLILNFLFQNGSNIHEIEKVCQLVKEKYLILSQVGFLEFLQDYCPDNFLNIFTIFSLCFSNQSKEQQFISILMNQQDSENSDDKIASTFGNCTSRLTFNSFSREHFMNSFSQVQDESVQSQTQFAQKDHKFRFSKAKVQSLPKKLKNIFRQNFKNKDIKNQKEESDQTIMNFEDLMECLYEQGIVKSYELRDYVFQLLFLSTYKNSHDNKKDKILEQFLDVCSKNCDDKTKDVLQQMLFQIFKIDYYRFSLHHSKILQVLENFGTSALHLIFNQVSQIQEIHDESKKQIQRGNQEKLPITISKNKIKLFSKNQITQVIDYYDQINGQENLACVYLTFYQEQNAILKEKRDKKYVKFLQKLEQLNFENIENSDMIKKEQQSACEILQNWDQLQVSLINDEQIPYQNDQGSLVFSNFNFLQQKTRDYLMSTLMYDKSNWKHLKATTDYLINSDSKDFMEKNYSKELCYSSLTQMDFERAYYYNELIKEELKKDLWQYHSKQTNLKENFHFKIKRYASTSAFLKWINKQDQLVKNEDTLAFMNVFMLNTHKDYQKLVFEKHMNDLQLQILLHKYEGQDTELITDVLCHNSIANIENLLNLDLLDPAKKCIKMALIERGQMLMNSDQNNLRFTQCLLRHYKQEIILNFESYSTNQAEKMKKILEVNSSQCSNETIKESFELLKLDLELFEYSQNQKEFQFINFENFKNHERSIMTVQDLDYNNQLMDLMEKILRTKIEQNNYQEIQELANMYVKTLLLNLTSDASSVKNISFLFIIFNYLPQSHIIEQYLHKIDLNIFLNWIPQLILLLKQKNDLFYQILQQLIELYPGILSLHLTFYSENILIQELLQEKINLLSNYQLLYEQISQNFYDPQLKLCDLLSDLKNNFNNQNKAEIIKEIHQMFKISDCNLIQKKFISNFKDMMMSILLDIERVQEIQVEGQIKEDLISNIFEKVASLQIQMKKQIDMRYKKVNKIRISNFSSKLDQFPYYFPNLEYFENVPKGQNKIKILNISKNVRVINSLRKPKKIEFICSDNKKRSMLIKTGEDLRTDQRIMTIFQMINQINQDENSQMKTYKVFPVTKQCGIIQWIDDTKTMKNLLQNAIPENIVEENSSFMIRKQFLNGISQNLQQAHLKLYEQMDSKIIIEYDKAVNLFKQNVLEQCFMEKFDNAQNYYEFRQKFLQKFATYCLIGYLLGLGDRHLENIMFTHDLEVFHVDFSCCFDLGYRLEVPDYIPFRFTPNLVKIGYPFENEGIFRSQMVKVFQNIQNHQDQFKNYVEIFIKEPIFDWKKYEIEYQCANEVSIKLDVFRDKIKGKNPYLIIQSLIKSLVQGKTQQQILNTFDRVDVTFNEEYLTPEQAVQTLLEISTDKKLLGRMWLGLMTHI